MATYVYWFVLALVLVGVEMATGTFYLLVLAIAMAVGGLAALLNASMAWQLTLSALAVSAGAIIVRRWKTTLTSDAASADLDAGQPVQVLKWNENGTARVFYRGAEWDADPEQADMPRDGTLCIKAIRGSRLILTHRK
ncbi:MAG TPA: NfeD family protein [Gallionellaceae bacterium]|nr:NfeD family protein [Gallionellaceae bacterium]